MKKRAVITVTGEVQSIGYREYVLRKAVENGLTGFAGNLPGGKVIIIADGEEEKIANFISDIKTPSPPGHVEDVKIDYQEADGAFPGFFTARDLEKNGDLAAKAETLMEYVRDINSQMGTMNSKLEGVNSKLDGMNSKLGNIEKHTTDSRDKLSSDLKEGFTGVREEIREMSRQTGEHFDRLDRKYDTFGNKLDGMASDMKAMRELLTVFVEHLMKKENAEA